MTPETKRQLYRLRPSGDGIHGEIPRWVRPDGVYEGDLGPASQGAPGGTVRLLCPDDPAACYVVDVATVEEID